MVGAQNSRLCLFSELFSGSSIVCSGNLVLQGGVDCFRVFIVQLHEYCINNDFFCLFWYWSAENLNKKLRVKPFCPESIAKLDHSTATTPLYDWGTDEPW